MMKWSICLDFDGVIHSYESGWKGADTIPDAPVVGTKEAIEELRKTYDVKVYSSRCGQEGGKQAMADWFLKHGIVVDQICDHKPPALVYVDDRGVTFNGNWAECIESIKNFNQWQRKVGP